jgi:2-haloacid dehalogenase
MGLELSSENEKKLMDQYAKLTSFEDSLLVLKRIKEQGI